MTRPYRVVRICGTRHDDPFSGRHHRCILEPDHVGPHWGPANDDPDRYHEWSLR